ncbi:GHKL domain-containing protein [Natronincola ferrireducens]|uniref:Sensor histidine kinase YesM n=1 Tax=Natronincola ferrireducens TaxID=393762 RepID=A0A1G9F3P3_9FIRM|nr:GHKL domain-containing protein [Natronincola ferrireducens]SDK82977.1 Sensor histidine kinase YesM [Natronincola ferrireducens]
MNVDNFRSIIVIAMEALIYINVLRIFIKVPSNKFLPLYLSIFISGIALVTLHSEMQYFYYFKTALGLLIFGAITIITLKIEFLKTMFMLFIYAILTLLGNVLSIFTMLFILNVTTIEIQNDTGLFFTANLISFSIIALLLYILKYIILYKRYGKSMQVKSKNIAFYILTVFSMLFINLYTFLYHVHEMEIFISILHIILIVAYITISLNYTFLENDFLYQKKLYKNQQEYLRVIENLLNGYRELKHGWQNYLTGFSGFIYGEERSWEGLTEYYESVIKKTKHLTNDSLSVLRKIKSYILLGLFIEKINEAEAEGIHVHINITGEELKMGQDCDFQIDLSFMLGNFLDNAVRHAKEADIPMIWIIIDNRGDYIDFIIKNTFNIMGTEATQRFDSGHGLKLVGEKVKKYPFIVHNTIIDEDVFTQELIVEQHIPHTMGELA